MGPAERLAAEARATLLRLSNPEVATRAAFALKHRMAAAHGLHPRRTGQLSPAGTSMTATMLYIAMILGDVHAYIAELNAP